MRINYLQISNILSFKHVEDVKLAEEILFDEGLNIVIGENGSGKSTALEVLNFLFRRVFYKQAHLDQDLYSKRMNLTEGDKKRVLTFPAPMTHTEFRLEPNWDTEDKPQQIRISVSLDGIDTANIQSLMAHKTTLTNLAQSYYSADPWTTETWSTDYTIIVTINRQTNSFTITHDSCADDFGFRYLSDYNLYKELINLHNLETSDSPVPIMFESFSLISSYRNYNNFNTTVSLTSSPPQQQMQQIRSHDFSRSLNVMDQSEPSVFGLVKLRIAEVHSNEVMGKKDKYESEVIANNQRFMLSINKRLARANLSCKIRLIDALKWQYEFEFFDIAKKRTISDINSLSAGQKSILHLVFEAYGRGDLKGGVVIIDEPELHLHYQFQHEYLEVLRDLIAEQGCQYILVTHSEALINSSTIASVKRFALGSDRATTVKAPKLSADQKTLIKILDNKRSTYAFFAKKVLLVEGDSDRYFYTAIIHEKYPQLQQEIAVLDMGGKYEHDKWRELFEAFGLTVFFIADLDYAYDLFYSGEQRVRLDTAAAVVQFHSSHPDLFSNIDSRYSDRIFVLKHGALEHYLGISGKKDLSKVIDFCNLGLPVFLNNTASQESVEVSDIMSRLTSQPSMFGVINRA